MAEHKSPLSKKELADLEKGVTTEQKGKVVPLSERVPSNPAYKHMTKKQFVAEMARLKEKKLAMQKYSKEYDEKKQAEIDELEKQQSGPGLDAEAAAPEKCYAVMKKGRKTAVKVFRGPTADVDAEKFIIGQPEEKRKDFSAIER